MIWLSIMSFVWLGLGIAGVVVGDSGVYTTGLVASVVSSVGVGVIGETRKAVERSVRT